MLVHDCIHAVCCSACWNMVAVCSYRYWPSTHASDDLAYNWWHLGVLHVLRSNARTGKSYGNASMHFYGLICSIVVYTSVHVQMYMYVHCTCTCMSQTPQIIGWYSHLICHCHCKSCMYIHLCVNLQRFHGILFWLKCQGHRSLHERDWSAANAAVVGAGLPSVSLWLHGHWRAQEGHCPHTWRRHTLCKSAFQSYNIMQLNVWRLCFRWGILSLFSEFLRFDSFDHQYHRITRAGAVMLQASYCFTGIYDMQTQLSIIIDTTADLHLWSRTIMSLR